MSKSLQSMFLVYAVVVALLGVLLLVIPGRFLGLFGWAPFDPILSRVFGAALLGLGWSSYRGWQAKERASVTVLLEMEAIFAILGAIGVLVTLFGGIYLWYVWLLFIILALLALTWLYFLFRK